MFYKKILLHFQISDLAYLQSLCEEMASRQFFSEHAQNKCHNS